MTRNCRRPCHSASASREQEGRAATEIYQAIEAVFRIERAALIAGLVRMVRDIGRAEELAQDALVRALGEWPRSGIPAKPGPWLITVAKRRAIDDLRRDRMISLKHAEIARERGIEADPEIGVYDMEEGGDELLNLIFIACHPVLSIDARVALTLRVVAGLTTAEIARAFVSSEAAVAQRIVRAKSALGRAGLAFEMPPMRERQARLGSVMEVIYLIFNEGYAATSGEDLVRPALCAEAQRLGRILVRLAPEEADGWGLLALMELQASRLRARMAADGSLVPLTRQNRAAWDHLLIRRGLLALERAEAHGGRMSSYGLQASIAACHARSRSAEDTDWVRIASLYDSLRLVMPSPVVDLNRAVAYSMAFGAEAGLELVDEIAQSAALRDYAPLPAARGDFLLRAGRADAARIEFERAARITQNARERSFLLGRAAACGD